MQSPYALLNTWFGRGKNVYILHIKVENKMYEGDSQ